MTGNLSLGALSRLCQGEDVVDPVLQVLGHKPITGSGQERYRLLLSDGQFTNSFSMLATQLNHMIHDKKLEQFTLIKVKKQVVNSVAGQTKKVVVILELEVVTPGSEVGQKYGNPVQMGVDGKAVAGAANQNTNPNAGAAAAVKRPAASGNNDQPPVKTTPAGGQRSVLTPRSTVSSAGQPITPIASITPYQNKWTIKARVSSKTDIKTWNKSTGSGKLFSMDLIDESGEIRVTAFKEQCDAFYDKAVVGKVYYISNCSVKNANKQYSKLKNEYELTFKDNGTFELCEEDSDVPTIAYDFVTISDLPTIEDREKTIDVIGIVKTAGDVANIVTKAGKELTKREVTLVDRSATEVTLTLWGTTAEKFDASSQPVIAVKNVRISDYNGVTLSGGDVMMNPDLAIAHELQGWWDNEGSSTQSRSITVAGSRGGEGGGGSSGNFKLIGDAKQDCMAGADKSEYYNVLAMTSFFSKDKALYKACGENLGDGKECNKKAIDQGDGNYRCEKCGVNKPQFNWRAILQLNMADCSDNLWATCFQDTAEKILGVSAQELGDALERDEERYNQIFQEATFKTFSFRMRAKEDTYNDERRMKHTVVNIETVDWEKQCANLIKEIEILGGTLPSGIDKSLYVK